jgi:hypothetical protein
MINQNNCFEWQPFGPVADNYLINSTAWINIAVGSIRSGKTIVALTRFIEYTLRSDNTEFMIMVEQKNVDNYPLTNFRLYP